MPAQRSFLFLQGMATQFFVRLGSALATRGHTVHRINFNGGDRLFWPAPHAVSFRRSLAFWPNFLEARLVEWRVTDIVLFGDCRPLHREAVRIASLRGIRVYVVDEGYIRPNWVTVEQGGVNGYSHLPRDPEWYRQTSKDTPPWDGGKPVSGSFTRRAIEDVAYNVTSVLSGWYYRGYRTHRPWHPFVEYAGWLRRFSRKPAIKRRAVQAMNAALTTDKDFFLFPLQLDCDSQIRQHSRLGRIAPWIENVLQSFSEHAPTDALLVIKEHPLDNGVSDWRALIRKIANTKGILGRVIYIEDGKLEPLLDRCRSVITVNSTVGFLALSYGLPVKVLGDAIYDMPGLTSQQPLDRFWSAPDAPDMQTFDAFRRVAVARTQVNGGFFSKDALKLAVAGTVARLEAMPFERLAPLASQRATEDAAPEDDWQAAPLPSKG